MLLILKYTPVIIQNVLISIYNTLQYTVRHSGQYKHYRKYYKSFAGKNYKEIEQEHKHRLDLFLQKSVKTSEWYQKYSGYTSLKDFPVLNKSDIINNLDEIVTIKESESVVSLTGGTTGASMKVLYSKENIQERHAILDNFRAEYGYSLGKKCAWFSGKNIVTQQNINNGICYRDDYINKIRFFSTFHITEANFDVYWNSFCDFSPGFIVGFPSSVYELCLLAQIRGLKLDKKVVAFFPTAETVLPVHRQVISTVLGCTVVDQYASSEGAPFILECKSGRLHIHPLTGVFEVVDENMEHANEGEILVTSFTTEGTPLIRYRIGDRIKLAANDTYCECGSHFPLVDNIEGRSTDYITSPTHGKVNLGNISNSTKGVLGILQFQVIQKKLTEVDILVVASAEYTTIQQTKFIAALTDRFGYEVKINHNIVDELPREKSGKFRIVKNHLSMDKA